jgi:hypothetical protein
MGNQARGKQSLSISDRSGAAFPYKEMVKEWQGSWVHISEYEKKHPQLDPPYHKADAIALSNVRSQDFQQPEIINGVEADSGGEGMAVVDLTLPGEFAFSAAGMIPDNGAFQNRQRQLILNQNSVTIVIS